ncbi:hypothetical protein OHO83_28905 [Streptomyces sp. NBC_00569]|uniref:hypothetical protein n=1 Tax=Streptomyces sp. NBC_00569 TaxID=2975780 RepID=UPI002E80684E|nr:hypothetical protein [Streptomyces sp. NBC_00569]WUB95989.1 hypothetical protein OHO83_28905 [Streptomyces sp. NBC_00569]
MPEKQRAPMRAWLYALVAIAFIIDLGVRAVTESSMITRAGAIFGLVVLAFAVGTVYGRQQERRKSNPQGPQGTPAPDISA